MERTKTKEMEETKNNENQQIQVTGNISKSTNMKSYGANRIFVKLLCTGMSQSKSTTEIHQQGGCDSLLCFKSPTETFTLLCAICN